MSLEESRVRRLRGRPPKLSPALIVEAAGEILADIPADEFTLGKVAEHLRMPLTSICNYFPNRFALLSVFAEGVFARFEFQDPPPEMPWPEAVMAWLRTIDDFFLVHPAAIKAIGIDDRVSPAWGAVRAPLLKQLRRAGFRGRDLAAALFATHAQLIGLLFMASFVLRPQPADGAFPPPEASSTEHDEAELRSWRKSVRREEIVGFGLSAIVRQLERSAAELAS